MWVSTFHSACVRMLRANGDRLGYPRSFSIYDQADSVRLTGYVIRDLHLDAKRFTPRGVHGAVSLWKNELVDPGTAAAGAQHIFERKHAEVYREYQGRLLKAGAMDFDDLLLNTVRLLREHPDVLEHYRERFEHVLVDEYQDTNQAQNEIVLLLAGGHHNVTVVGDTDQSVYRFRGADFRNIVQFEDAFPDVTTVVLDQNYRSTQTILDAANAVIANNPARKPKNLWTDAGAGHRIIRYHAEDEGDEATFVASTARQLHDDHAMNWREVAVLYRTNAQSRVVEEAMMRLGVPYKVVGGTRFYDRREVKDAMAYLRAVVNPADEVNVKRVLNVPKRGIGDASVAKLDAYAAGEGDRIPRRPAPRRRRRGHRAGRPRHRLVRHPHRRARGAGGGGAGHRRRRHRRHRAGDLLQAALERSGYLAELEAEDTVESAGRIENLGELVGSAREFTRIDEFLEQVSLVADTDDIDRRRPGRADDPALREGPGVPDGVPHRRRGGRVPAHPGADRAGRAGGGAPPRLRRHHPGPRAALHHPRLESQPVRLDAVQPAVAVPRGDPRRADRVEGQHHRALGVRPPEPAAPLGLGRARRRTAADAAMVTTPRTNGVVTPIASASSTPPCPPAGAVRSAAMRTTSGCASATTSSTRRSARA